MKLKQIEVNNFFNHINTKIDFDEFSSPLLVLGNNGDGKSSFFVESITYALFGEVRLESLDECIYQDADEMSVLLDFELNGQNIKIDRSKKRTKSQKLKLFIDGTEVTELLSETQERINGLVKLSYPSFLSSAILKQEDADFFVNQKPDDRKKIISDILNLEFYALMEKVAKEMRSTIKSEVRSEEAFLNTIEIQDIEHLKTILSNSKKQIRNIESKSKEYEEALKKIEAYNTKIQTQIEHREAIIEQNRLIKKQIESDEIKISTLDKDIQALNEQISALHAKKDSINQHDLDLKEILIQLEESIQDLNNANKLVTAKFNKANGKIHEELNDKAQELNRLSGEYDTHRTIASRKLRNIDELDSAQCPTCLQKVDKVYQSKLKDDLLIELNHLKSKTIEIEKDFKEIKKIRDSISKQEYEPLKPFIEEMETITKQIQENGHAKSLILTQIENENQINHEIELKEQKRNIYQENLNTLRTTKANRPQLQEVPEVTDELMDASPLTNELTTLKKDLKEQVAIETRCEQMISQCEENQKKKDKLTREISFKKRQLALLEKLCVAFSRNGIPALIIETVLPEIETTANLLLDKFTNGTFSLRFRTLETLKNGSEKETLDIDVFDGYQWRRFESYSGGEQFRISLSIRLALSKVLSQKSGLNLDLLILDEPASSLDVNGKDILIDIINGLSSEFANILVMTHLTLGEEFSNKVDINALKV